jgi:hypothetical protein
MQCGYEPQELRPFTAQVAEEAGLGKPMAKRRVPELAEAIIATLPKVDIADPFAEAVATLIRQRCERAMNSFRR